MGKVPVYLLGSRHVLGVLVASFPLLGLTAILFVLYEVYNSIVSFLAWKVFKQLHSFCLLLTACKVEFVTHDDLVAPRQKNPSTKWLCVSLAGNNTSESNKRQQKYEESCLVSVSFYYFTPISTKHTDIFGSKRESYFLNLFHLSYHLWGKEPTDFWYIRISSAPLPPARLKARLANRKKNKKMENHDFKLVFSQFSVFSWNGKFS